VGQNTQERPRSRFNPRGCVSQGDTGSCPTVGAGLRREDRRRLASNLESMSIVIAAAATVVTMRIAVSPNVSVPAWVVQERCNSPRPDHST
jgi:hypothetical protein